MKTDCTIKNWQIHNIVVPKKHIKLFKDRFPTALLKPGPLLFTGTVIEDSKGRWNTGDHMRSTYISSINRKTGIIKTQNTTYKVLKEGNDIFPDIGNDILKIFY